MSYLTFDLGTTRLKTALFDTSGKLLGQVVHRHQDHHDGERSWQSAEGWWQACCSSWQSLARSLGDALPVPTGISVSGRAGAAILVGDAGEVLADPWSDLRHAAELRELRDQMPLYAATLIAKYRWWCAQPGNAPAAVRHALYGKDFLIYRLTGCAVTDPSSGPDGLAWPAGTGDHIEPEKLPAPQLPWSLAGELTPQAAAALGLPTGLPVAVGAHDGVAANIGAGATRDNELALTLGTHVVLRCPCVTAPRALLRFYQFPPDRHVVGANALWSGRAIDWALDTFAPGPAAERSTRFATINRDLAQSQARADAPLYLPYPGGQISPSRHPTRRAAFHGIGLLDEPRDLFYAVMEGVTFAVRENYQSLCAHLTPLPTIQVTGGGIHSPYWLRMIASVLNTPLAITDDACEGRGVAMCLAVACGAYPDLLAARAMIPASRLVAPEPDLAAVLQARFATWSTIAATETDGPTFQ